MSSNHQRPTDTDSLTQWQLYNNKPRERRYNRISANVIIFGEAPSGSHIAEARWLIWKEERDNAGNIYTEYAQHGRNDLRWIYNEVAFDPSSDPTAVPPSTSGTVPYAITLSNETVLDGSPGGTVVGAITVVDDDSVIHTLSIVDDPFSIFNIVGANLVTTAVADVTDIAYPVKIRAVDPEGNSYEQYFAITVVDAAAPAPYTTGITQTVVLSDAAWTLLPAAALVGRNSIAIQNETGFDVEVAYDDGIAYGEGMLLKDGNERQYNNIPATFEIYARLEPAGVGSVRVEEII